MEYNVSFNEEEFKCLCTVLDYTDVSFDEIGMDSISTLLVDQLELSRDEVNTLTDNLWRKMKEITSSETARD